MKRLLVLFFILLISVWLGVQLNKDPGYVLIAINHWTLETPLWFAAFSLFILFIVLHVCFQFCKQVSNSKTALHNYCRRRRYNKSRNKTRQGLIEFSEGYWQDAETHLVKGLGNNDVPLINYLAAAKAAQEQGNNKQRDNYLREAQQSVPDAKIAIELTQAQLQLANNQWEQALATLKHLQSMAPKHPYVIKLLMKLYLAIKDWPQLLELLPTLKRFKVIDNKGYEELELTIHQHLLQSQAEKLTVSQLLKHYANLPRSVQANPAMISTVSKLLLAKGSNTESETLIRNSLKKNWHEDLIELYGRCPIENSKKQLNFTESLIKQYPHSAKLYLSLGRLSSHNQLWGKARSYLEKSIEICPSAQAYYELAKLLDNLHDAETAKQYYQQGLEMSLSLQT